MTPEAEVRKALIVGGAKPHVIKMFDDIITERGVARELVQQARRDIRRIAQESAEELALEQ